MEELLKTYAEIFSKKDDQPDWAVRKINNKEDIVIPSIPFIGKCYEKTRILLYASVENLNDYDGRLDDNNIAENRHRFWFDNYSNRFFPNFHIEPVSNGALVNIIGYISIKLFPENKFDTPKELLERVAIANFGKFSIRVEAKMKNIDYAGDYKKLFKSFEYVKADLELLRPNILILPERIFRDTRIKEMIKSIIPNALIIPIIQITPTTINTKLAKEYIRKPQNEIGILNEWHKNINGRIKGKIRSNYYSIYTYLDDILEKINNDKLHHLV